MVEKPRLKQLDRMIKNQAAKIERLRAALRPFGNAVFNDNGDITVDYSMAGHDDYVKAYFALHPRAQAEEDEP